MGYGYAYGYGYSELIGTYFAKTLFWDGMLGLGLGLGLELLFGLGFE